MNNNDSKILNCSRSEIHEQCAGKNCNKNGLKKLRIHFIGKTGYFCKMCSDELLELNLASEDAC
jgi:hypothetical protein